MAAPAGTRGRWKSYELYRRSKQWRWPRKDVQTASSPAISLSLCSSSSPAPSSSSPSPSLTPVLLLSPSRGSTHSLSLSLIFLQISGNLHGLDGDENEPGPEPRVSPPRFEFSSGFGKTASVSKEDGVCSVRSASMAMGGPMTGVMMEPLTLAWGSVTSARHVGH